MGFEALGFLGFFGGVMASLIFFTEEIMNELPGSFIEVVEGALRLGKVV